MPDREAPRRSACEGCPTYEGKETWRCSDHQWVTRFGKWWIGTTGAVIVMLFPVVCALLWFIAQLNTNLAVTISQFTEVKATQSKILDRIDRIERERFDGLRSR